MVMSPRTFIVDSPEKRDHLLNVLAKLPMDGEIWDIRVKKWEPIRSLEQNSRLHLIFYRVAQATGNDIEDVKLGYKALFLPPINTTFHGKPVTRYPKTSRMTKQQLNEFMDKVEMHAVSEYGVLIGDNEFGY